jgi:hypothetical protein
LFAERGLPACEWNADTLVCKTSVRNLTVFENTKVDIIQAFSERSRVRAGWQPAFQSDLFSSRIHLRRIIENIASLNFASTFLCQKPRSILNFI